MPGASHGAGGTNTVPPLSGPDPESTPTPICAYRSRVAQLPLGFVRKKGAAPRDAGATTTSTARTAERSPDTADVRASPDPSAPPAAPGPAAQPGSGRDERTVYSVSELCAALGQTLEQSHPHFWVEGEISGLRVHRGSGHLYFELKDERGKIPCVVWSSNRRRIRFDPKDGTEVVCHAKTSLYPRSGKLQLSVFFMEPRGLGALYAELEALRERLRSEGLTAAERKRPVPSFPAVVGLVTSRHGAALHDVLTTLWRRHPGLHVRLAPAPVQGRGAGARLRAALRRLDDSGCDVIIVARGGGSLEDLWAFNEEPVARAIAACKTPIVTGIGHETDVTLADQVADVRASTPTAAAEAVAPVLADWSARLARAEGRLARALQADLRARRRVLEGWKRQLRHPAERHRALRAELQNLEHRLHRAMRRLLEQRTAALHGLQRRVREQHPRLRLERARAGMTRCRDRLDRALAARSMTAHHRLSALSGRLEASSPLAVLSRGYAFVTDDEDRVVRRADQLTPDASIHIRWANGHVDATVTAVHPLETSDDDYTS